MWTENIGVSVMSLTVGSLSINSGNFLSRTSGVVSGTELQQVSSEILAQAPTATVQKAEHSTPSLDLKIFNADSQLTSQTARQIAANQAGFDVSLSEQALSAIETLRTQAAKSQSANLSRNMDGKVFIPFEKAELANIKSVFAYSNPVQLQKTINIFKDNQARNFYFTPNGEQKEQTPRHQHKKQKELNLVI